MNMIGHNSGVGYATVHETEAASAIHDALAPWQSRKAALIESFKRAPLTVESEEVAKSVTTLIAQISQLRGRFEAAHDTAKLPYLDAGRVVDGITNAEIEPIADAANQLSRRLTQWQDSEAKRIEAERLAEKQSYIEAGDPEPTFVPIADKIKQHTTIRAESGASAHLRNRKIITIEDPRKIPVRYLKRPKVLAAIAAEVKADIDRGDEIKGVIVTNESKSAVRK